MLRWRLSLGAILIAALVGLFWLDHRTTPPGVVLFPLVLLLAVLASSEIVELLSAGRSIGPLRLVVYAGNVGIVGANWLAGLFPDGPLGALGWPLAALALAVLAVFVGEMRRYEGPGEVAPRLGLSLVGLTYVGLLLSFMAQMRFLGPGQNGAWGIAAIASMVVSVKLCDVGAYTVGRLIGRHKMAPVLSPGKTIEGSLGGIVFACLGSWIALEWLTPQITGLSPRCAWAWIPYGILMGGAGMAGDLAESLLKRDAGRKDSSRWMPGFGGVLDLLDSLLFAAPVAYLCWKCGLVDLIKVAGS